MGISWVRGPMGPVWVDEMNRTKIEYLDFTWNPIAMLCDPVSAGCRNCWHLRMANRLANNPKISEIHRQAYAGKIDPWIVIPRLNEPCKVKKPGIIGVQFMGDLFHEKIDFYTMTSLVVSEIEDCDWHTFLVLTKRPDRLLELHDYLEYENTDGSGRLDTSNWEWPKNLWLGVSVEDPSTLWRVDKLLQIPAAVKFVSVEPILENIDISKQLDQWWDNGEGENSYFFKAGRLLSWVIAGPETGPGARPCPEGAIENLYWQCQAAGIPFFDKRPDYLAREFPKCGKFGSL